MKNNQHERNPDIFNGLDSSEARQKTAKQIMSDMNEEDRKSLFEILGDREKLNAVLNSPAAQSIISKLNGHK